MLNGQLFMLFVELQPWSRLCGDLYSMVWMLAIRNIFQSIFPDLRLCQPMSSSLPAVEPIFRGLGWIFGLVCDSQMVMDVMPSMVIRNMGAVLVVAVIVIPSIRAINRFDRDFEDQKGTNR